MTRKSYSFDHAPEVKQTSTSNSGIANSGRAPNLNSVSREKASSKMQIEGKLPLIIGGLIGLGLLIALIVVSVSLGQKTSESEGLRREVDSLKATATTGGPGQSNTTARTITVTGPTAGLATLGPTPSLPGGELRLSPTAVRPSHYDLFLQVNVPYDDADPLADKWTTKGSVEITLTAGVSVTSIRLHARHQVATNSRSGHIKPFPKEKVTLKKVGGDAISVTSVDYLQHDNIVINAASSLEVSPVQYVLKVEFEGYVADDNEGIYRSQYTKGKDPLPKYGIIISSIRFMHKKTF